MTAYYPTVQLDESTWDAIESGSLQLQTGQWVRDLAGMGRLYRDRGQWAVLWRKAGEKVQQYNYRLSTVARTCRAVGVHSSGWLGGAK